GMVSYHEEQEIFAERGGLGGNAEVYDAELTGIARTARTAARYTRMEHWGRLREVNEQLEMGIPLGTEGGLEVRAKFLEKSGAFMKTGKS
ncbi:hypothetical protein J132_09436, partial [Termitomyces sp. J132]